MSTILLIRHADYPAIGQGLKGRLPEIHLSKKGQEQAEQLADLLGPVPLRAVYSSPLARARETAEPIARRAGLPVRIVEEVQEIDYGDWTGREVSTMTGDPLWRRLHEQRTRVRVPGGERMIEIAARMVDALEEMDQRHRDEIVAVVSHGDPIRSALCVYLGLSLDFLDRFEILPASISVLELNDHGVRLRCCNLTGGLAGLVAWHA